MKTCKTCNHWQYDREEDYRLNPELGIRPCKATKMFWDSTRWDEKGKREFIDSTATAFVQDGSDYQAWLYTKAEHGCTMHEEIKGDAISEVSSKASSSHLGQDNSDPGHHRV